MPTTTSQATLSGLRMNQPAVAAPVDHQRLEIGLRAALLDAVFRHHPHAVADFAQRDSAAPGSKTQVAFSGLLLHVGDVAGIAARPEPRAPVASLQLAAVRREAHARVL